MTAGTQKAGENGSIFVIDVQHKVAVSTAMVDADARVDSASTAGYNYVFIRVSSTIKLGGGSLRRR